MIVTHIICDGCGAKVEGATPEAYAEYHRIVVSKQAGGTPSIHNKGYDLCNDCGVLLDTLLANHSIQKVLRAKGTAT